MSYRIRVGKCQGFGKKCVQNNHLYHCSCIVSRLVSCLYMNILLMNLKCEEKGNNAYRALS